MLLRKKNCHSRFTRGGGDPYNPPWNFFFFAMEHLTHSKILTKSRRELATHHWEEELCSQGQGRKTEHTDDDVYTEQLWHCRGRLGTPR